MAARGTRLLDRLHLLALRLAPLRLPLTLAGGAFLLLILAAILGPAEEMRRLLQPGIIGAVWCGMLYSFIRLFHNVPPMPGAGDPFLRRLSLRVRRAFHAVLAACVLLATVMLVSLTVRLLLV